MAGSVPQVAFQVPSLELTPRQRQLLDTAVAEVFSNDNVLKAYRRYGATRPIVEQIHMRFSSLLLETERDGP